MVQIDDMMDGYYSILTVFTSEDDVKKFIDYLNKKYSLAQAYHDEVCEGVLYEGSN